MPYEWLPIALARLAADIEPRWVQQALEDNRPRWPRPTRHPSGLLLVEVWSRDRRGTQLIITVRLSPDRNHTIVDARRMTAEEGTLYAIWEAEHHD